MKNQKLFLVLISFLLAGNINAQFNNGMFQIGSPKAPYKWPFGSEAGLEVNDEIIKIKNANISEINKNELKTIFEKEHSEVSITIKHQATIKTISVKLRRLI